MEGLEHEIRLAIGQVEQDRKRMEVQKSLAIVEVMEDHNAQLDALRQTMKAMNLQEKDFAKRMAELDKQAQERKDRVASEQSRQILRVMEETCAKFDEQKAKVAQRQAAEVAELDKAIEQAIKDADLQIVREKDNLEEKKRRGLLKVMEEHADRLATLKTTLRAKEMEVKDLAQQMEQLGPKKELEFQRYLKEQSLQHELEKAEMEQRHAMDLEELNKDILAASQAAVADLESQRADLIMAQQREVEDLKQIFSRDSQQLRNELDAMTREKHDLSQRHARDVAEMNAAIQTASFSAMEGLESQRNEMLSRFAKEKKQMMDDHAYQLLSLQNSIEEQKGLERTVEELNMRIEHMERAAKQKEQTYMQLDELRRDYDTKIHNLQMTHQEELRSREQQLERLSMTLQNAAVQGPLSGQVPTVGLRPGEEEDDEGAQHDRVYNPAAASWVESLNWMPKGAIPPPPPQMELREPAAEEKKDPVEVVEEKEPEAHEEAKASAGEEDTKDKDDGNHRQGSGDYLDSL